jgi:hypothetical protein
VLAVLPDAVELLDLPPAHLPQLRHAERIRGQLAVSKGFGLQRLRDWEIPHAVAVEQSLNPLISARSQH